MSELERSNLGRSPIVAEMLSAAAHATRSGERERALKLLRKAAETDPYDEAIWWGLLEVVSSRADRLVCLENVLAINPSNAEARRLLRLANIGYDIGEMTPPMPAETLSPPPSGIRPLSTAARRPLGRTLIRAAIWVLVIALLVAALIVVLTLLNNGFVIS